MNRKKQYIIGQKLAYCRNSIPLSQQKTGEILNIERSLLAHYESGKTLPFLPILLKFSQTFHISMEDLADEELSLKDFILKYPDSYFSNLSF